jgi:predicted RNA binding protein YcfA (HicA-like mRNA interferase family)
MKVREILKLLKDDGWYFVTTEGSHRQFKHSTKPGRVTVAGHPSDDIRIAMGGACSFLLHRVSAIAIPSKSRPKIKS